MGQSAPQETTRHEQLPLIWKPFRGDPCGRKSRGNPQSREAFVNKVKPNRAKRQKQILDALRAYGAQTVHEIRRSIYELHGEDLPIHHWSGRITELKAEQFIYATGAKRDGCGVVDLVERRKNFCEAG